MRRVVITGVGPVTPIGIGKDDFWTNLVDGKSRYAEITRFPLQDWDQTRIAAEIKDFEPSKYGVDPILIECVRKFGVKNAGLALYYGLAAAELACRDADLSTSLIDRSRAGVIMGTGAGDLALLQRGNGEFIHEAYTLPNILAGSIAKRYDLHGFSTMVGAACASGNVALRLAYNEIQKGNHDVMLVGASEAPIDTPHMFGGAEQRKKGIVGFSKKNDVEKGMMPFDQERDGIILSEGAGVLVLEERMHAQRRNARMYTEILSYGDYTDFDRNFVRTTAVGYRNAMGEALKTLTRIEYKKTYVNTHGTAMPLNDPCESEAIHTLCKKKSPVSSFKGTLGHAQAAAPAIELIGCVLALEKRFIPKSNFTRRASDCADLDYVTSAREMKELEYVVKNAAGFNGSYSTIVLGRA